MQRQDAIMAAQLAAYRKQHRSNFIENTAVTVAKGTVTERPIMEPRGEIVMPIVFDGVMVEQKYIKNASNFTDFVSK